MAKKKKQQLVVAKHINPKLGQLKMGLITKYRGTLILLGFKMCDDFGSEDSGGSDSRQKFGRRSESRPTFLQVVSTHAALLPPSPPTPQNGEFRSLFRIRYWLSAHLKMLIINLVPTLAARRLYNEETPGWKLKTLAVVDDCSGWLLWMVYNCNQCHFLYEWERCVVSLWLPFVSECSTGLIWPFAV